MGLCGKGRGCGTQRTHPMGVYGEHREQETGGRAQTHCSLDSTGLCASVATSDIESPPEALGALLTPLAAFSPLNWPKSHPHPSRSLPCMLCCLSCPTLCDPKDCSPLPPLLAQTRSQLFWGDGFCGLPKGPPLITESRMIFLTPMCSGHLQGR